MYLLFRLPGEGEDQVCDRAALRPCLQLVLINEVLVRATASEEQHRPPYACPVLYHMFPLLAEGSHRGDTTAGADHYYRHLGAEKGEGREGGEEIAWINSVPRCQAAGKHWSGETDWQSTSNRTG